MNQSEIPSTAYSVLSIEDLRKLLAAAARESQALYGRTVSHSTLVVYWEPTVIEGDLQCSFPALLRHGRRTPICTLS